MSAAASGGDPLLGKNPGVTSLVSVWWLCLIAKGIISNKIGRGRKDRVAYGGRDGAEVLIVGSQVRPLGSCSAPGFCRGISGEEETERRGGLGAGALGRGARRGSGEISWAHRQACALGASSRLGEAFIPGSERPAADCGAGEQLDYC